MVPQLGQNRRDLCRLVAVRPGGVRGGTAEFQRRIDLNFDRLGVDAVKFVVAPTQVDSKHVEPKQVDVEPRWTF